jgi:predicted ATPase
MSKPGARRVVVTGGPGGGKTTAVDLFRREIGDAVVVVPEAATLLFAGGFPRSDDDAVGRATQRAVFEVQRGLEDAQARLYPGRLLICDRGTVDGAAYWPGEPDTFFAAMGTTLDKELARYDAVLFFETAAAGGHAIETGNRYRNEDQATAVKLDRALRALWERHPSFTLIANHSSFVSKVVRGVEALQGVVDGGG